MGITSHLYKEKQKTTQEKLGNFVKVILLLTGKA